MRRLLVLLSIGTLAAASEGIPRMDETLRKVVGRSDVVAVAAMLRGSLVEVAEAQFLRAEMQCREVLKGNAPVNAVLTVDIRAAGKETPNLEPGRDYVLFLKPLTGRPAALVTGMRPLSVPPTDAARFLRWLRLSVALYERNPSGHELKEHVFRMLDSYAPFFESDATRLAAEIPEWSPAELDRLIAILESEHGTHAVEGDDRTNAEAVVARFADPPRLAAFGRFEYRLGAGDGIYYGLLDRKNGNPDAVVRELFADPDDRVKIGALRLAGLLRRGDLIDTFPQRPASATSDAVRRAIANARALVTRDF